MLLTVWLPFFSLLVVISVEANRLTERKTVSDYLDTCMLGKLHKQKPGPEGDLYNECTPWKYKSCCMGNTTNGIHKNQTWYKFDWNHCGNLSQKCKKHFVQDLCIYECSPNLGPWLVQVSRSWRSERFVSVPLCQSECTAWWNDCKDDMTCVDNWSAKGNFNFSTGKNKCPDHKPCKKFSQVYSSHVDFCQKIWDGSWRVVADSEPCFHITFNPENYPNNANPNDKVARQRALELVKLSTSNANQCALYEPLLSLVACLVLLAISFSD